MLATVGFYLVLFIYFVVCAILVMVVLMQEGKGGGLSGMAGSAALGETFGFGGATAAMRKWTRNIAIAFVVLTLVLTFWGEHIAGSFGRQFLSGGGAAPGAVPTATAPAGAQRGGAPGRSAARTAPATNAPAAPASNAPAAPAGK